MVTLSEVSTALHGAWRLACLDRGGIAYFDRSETGFWRSFYAALLIYPAFLILLGLRLDDAAWQSSGVFRILLVETIGYVIIWCAFPLVMLPVSRFLGREARWLDFIIVYNWAQVLEIILSLLADGLIGAGLLGDSLATGLYLATVVAVLLYEWFIARTVLEVSGAAAAMIVLTNVVLVRLISRVADGLAALGAASQ
jgi:hypothetical protein